MLGKLLYLQKKTVAILTLLSKPLLFCEVCLIVIRGTVCIVQLCIDNLPEEQMQLHWPAN